MYNTTQKGV